MMKVNTAELGAKPKEPRLGPLPPVTPVGTYDWEHMAHDIGSNPGLKTGMASKSHSEVKVNTSIVYQAHTTSKALATEEDLEKLGEKLFRYLKNCDSKTQAKDTSVRQTEAERFC